MSRSPAPKAMEAVEIRMATLLAEIGARVWTWGEADE
jgi:hypothetical protein